MALVPSSAPQAGIVGARQTVSSTLFVAGYIYIYRAVLEREKKRKKLAERLRLCSQNGFAPARKTA